jgi:hypothetical protein
MFSDRLIPGTKSQGGPRKFLFPIYFFRHRCQHPENQVTTKQANAYLLMDYRISHYPTTSYLQRKWNFKLLSKEFIYIFRKTMTTFLALKYLCTDSKPFTIKHYTSILLSIKIHYMLPIQHFKERAHTLISWTYKIVPLLV